MARDTYRRTSYYGHKRVKPRGQFWLNHRMKSGEIWGQNYFIYDTFGESAKNDKAIRVSATTNVSQSKKNIGTVDTGKAGDS